MWFGFVLPVYSRGVNDSKKDVELLAVRRLGCNYT